MESVPSISVPTVISPLTSLTSIFRVLKSSLQTVQMLLSSRKPTRIVVFVRANSPLLPNQPKDLVNTASSTLEIAIEDSNPTLLFIEKWGRMDVLVFDVFHPGYDHSIAHQVANLPVVLVDYGKRYSVVKIAGSDLKTEVNVAIAREHNLNGWDARPPYVADHTGNNIPTYPNPRDLITPLSKPT